MHLLKTIANRMFRSCPLLGPDVCTFAGFPAPGIWIGWLLIMPKLYFVPSASGLPRMTKTRRQNGTISLSGLGRRRFFTLTKIGSLASLPRLRKRRSWWPTLAENIATQNLQRCLVGFSI